MDTQSVTARLDAALAQQVTLAGGDPAVEAAGETLRAALAPAARQMALELAEQAATEIAAQLPDHDVEVVLRDGEPALAVRQARGHEPSVDEDLEARITLRLPPSVKARVEEAAGTMGDSVNAWVVKTLSAKATRPSGPGRRVSGTVRT
ncbi:MAG: toxin-antitoxin system HicB family antitoxin [Euzebyales bacterium]|nr:toxin-antitoxin system HicB family antitoxin [Euzebyales bacterium]